MALKPALQIRQTTKLALTPELRQAIGLLQLPLSELRQYLDEQIQENPLLEMEESPADAEESRPAKSLTKAQRAARAQAAWQATRYGPALTPPAAARKSGGETGEGRLPDAPAGVSLKDHLLEQLPAILERDEDKRVAAAFLEAIDEAGYLHDEPGDIARMAGVGADTAARVLARLQGLDPPGVFARSLEECLRLQLQAQGTLDPEMESLLAHLPALAAHDFETLCAACGVGRAELKDLIARLRMLHPKPGLLYGDSTTPLAVPDLSIEKRAGRWVASLNEDLLPRLRLNSAFERQLSRQMRAREERQYLRDQSHAANALVRAVARRGETLLALGTFIAERQTDFFDHGTEQLRAVTLAEAAAELGLHESTISRLAANKYLQCPRGIFALSFFFGPGIRVRGENTPLAAAAVQRRIGRLIEDEDSERPLSDAAITRHLRDRGLEIARRTVAKYRERAGIPSSAKRRRNYWLDRV